MKLTEIAKKAQLLKSGGIVQIDGLMFKAMKIEGGSFIDCCSLCDLDSICRGDVFDICVEMETKASHNWILQLAFPDDPV